MSNLYEILDVCLQELENGADLDTVLFRYPEFAEELRPILETSIQARNIAGPDPSSDAVRRNRAKVLQHAAQLREAKARPSRGLWSLSLRRALVSLAVVATLFISGTSLVRAASVTVPGDNLYPVKRTWEDVRVLFTFDVRAREALEVEHENERLEELYELFAEGRSVKVDFAGLVTRQNGDLWLVSKIPVVISPQTDLRDEPVMTGDAVRVRGVTQSDGTVLAERVDLLEAGVPLPEVEDDDSLEFEQDNSRNANEAHADNSGPGSGNDAPETLDSEREDTSLEGTVDSVNGNIVILDNQPLDISNAEIRGTATAGAQAKAEGYFANNGIFIVTRIEFDESTSGGDDSGSNDNENDNDNSNDDGNDDNGSDDSNDNDINDDSHDDNDNSNDNDGDGGSDDDADDSSGSGGGDDD